MGKQPTQTQKNVTNPMVRKVFCYISSKDFSDLMAILWKKKNPEEEKPNLGKFLDDLISNYIKENKE